MVSSTVAGFCVTITLIIAIGAQNLFVLRQGLRREHIIAVTSLCIVSDSILIFLGISGLSMMVAKNPEIATTARWGAAAFLLGYALFAARRALHPVPMTTTDTQSATLRHTLLMCLAFTYLNPHVYVDTVLLLGTLAHQYQNPWLFGVGAQLASAVWFTALGAGSHRLAPLLAKPQAWRIVETGIAALMVTIAVAIVQN